MARRLLVAVLVVLCAAPASAGKRARARQCKQACGVPIQQCVDGGGRRGKCKRQVLRRCKSEGITVCVPPGTYAVALTGSDAPGCGAPDAPCRTIQFVLDELVPPGGVGTIKVAAGTYDDVRSCNVGSIANQTVVCIINRHITLRGGFVPPDWDTPSSDPGATVLDAKGEARVLRVLRSTPNEAAGSLEMDGFTLQNGLAQGASSGGVDAMWVAGGGMLAENSALTLRNVVFRDNQVIGGTTGQAEGGRASGGGLAMYDTDWSTSTAVATLQNVTFERNHARGGGGADVGGYALGGAIFAYWTALSGDGVVFTDNSATAGSTNGAGFSGSDKGDALGGAVAASLHSTVDLRHVGARGNVATGGDAANGEAGGAFGGAFFAELATLTLTEAVVEGNRAQGGDGKNETTAASLAQAGGVFATMSSLTLDRARVVGNEVRAGDGVRHGGVSEGGGVAVTLGARDGVDVPFTIRNSVIASNLVAVGSGTLVGGGGGGLFLQGARGTVEHATIADNRLGEPHLLGGGIGILALPGWPTHVTVTDSILANHRSPASHPSCYADAALWAAENTSATVTRVLFANNIHDTNGGISGGCNVPSGAVGTSGVLTAGAAGFVSAGAPDEDYHLVAGSPAIDRAAGTVAVDLDGNARPSGTSADLGAYEFAP
jgi:hypothetical protein